MRPNKSGLDDEFCYLTSDDFYLILRSEHIDSFWKHILLNKITLVSLGDEDAFADIYSEISHTKKNGFSCFKKRRV